MKTLFRLMSEISDAGGASGDPAPGADGAGAGDADFSGDISPEKALYGDLAVEWPEGMDDSLKGEPSLKSFVNDEGKVNYANLAKSFLHSKKQIGMDKVTLPTENSTTEEVNEFWEKLGYKADEADYKLEAIEDSKLSDEVTASLTKFAHENKIPLATANKMAQFMNTQTVAGAEKTVQQQNEAIEAGLEGVKKEYGQAYDAKLGVAKRVLELVDDESITKAFDDPTIGSNPAVIKALVNIGEKLFKEDGFKGKENAGIYSPEEAQEQINTIMMDKSHPYNLHSHPNHAKAVKDMMKLYEMKN